MSLIARISSSIRGKLLVTLVVITLCPIFAAGYLQYKNAEQAVYDLTIADLQYLTSLTARELSAYTRSDNLSDAEREKVDSIVRDVAERYYKPNGMNGYAFILDQKGIAIFHPTAKGKDLSGEDFFPKMVEKKRGWIEYVFQGELKVTAFETLPNGWILGIGSYTDDLLRPINKSKLTMLVISLIAFAAALSVGIFIVRRLTEPIRELVEAMRRAETGDLTRRVTVKTRDELGRLSAMYNEMMSVFRNMLKDVQLVSEQVASSSEELTASAAESARASEQIATSASEIAAGSDKQKQSVMETTSSLHRIGKDLEQIGMYMQKVNEDSQVAQQYAHNGEKTLQELVAEMDDITVKVGRTESVVRELGERSEAIMGIITIIREISDQTNLLALNAAIEAARAGEQGRSFAVVATEVRKLAEESGKAAEQISGLILSINDEIKQAVAAMEETSQTVLQGRDDVSAAGEAFQNILRTVDDVGKQISNMNSSIQAIVKDTEQIVRNADHISKLAETAASDTQEVAAASEQQSAATQEMTAASETLAQMAEKLSEMAKRFAI